MRKKKQKRIAKRPPQPERKEKEKEKKGWALSSVHSHRVILFFFKGRMHDGYNDDGKGGRNEGKKVSSAMAT